MTLRAIQLASIVLHLFAAATWFGAMVFFAAGLVPVLRAGDEEKRRRLIDATGRRLRAVVWPLFGLLILTGTLQLWLRGYRWPDVLGPMWEGAAGHALAWKLGLFAVVLILGAIHDFVIGPNAVRPGGDARAAQRRRVASWAGRLTLLLAAAILAAAVVFVRGGVRP